MTIETRGNRTWLLLAAVAAIAFAALGASSMYVYMRRSMASVAQTTGTAAVPPPSPTAPATATKRVEGPLPDVTITLTP